MSGETKLKTFNDRLKDFEKLLKQYTDAIGLNKIIYNSEVDTLLSYNKEQLDKLSVEDCAEGAFILSQYALFLQKEINKQKVKQFWANKHLDRIVAQQEAGFTANNKSFIKYELLKQKVINGDSSASALNGIIVHATGRIMELDGLSHHIHSMSRYLSQLEHIKRNRK